MSLKTFHLIFITAASALAFGCGVWALKDYASPAGTASDLAFGLLALAVGMGLILYERYFLKKLKKVSFL
jgi:hypothetical protein